MGDPEARRDFPRQDPRAAFCFSTYRRARGLPQRRANDLSDQSMFYVQAELDGPVREETLRGRTHLVAPATMLREIVLPGWDAFIPWSEIQRTIDEHTWEGKPIVLSHPTKNGQFISAGHVDVAERWIGAVHNVKDGGDHRLRGEVWIDVGLAERFEKGAQLLDDIRAGKRIEVSTGYLSGRRPQGGEFQGRRYSNIHEHLIPDHFAVGVGEGQCNVGDGCGINNDLEGQMSGEADKLGVFMATMQAVGNALGITRADSTDGKTDDGGKGAPQVVVNVHAPQGGEAMADEQKRLIKALVECKDCELTKEQLDGSSLEVLRALTAASAGKGEGEDGKGGEKGKDDGKEKQLTAAEQAAEKAAVEKKAADEKVAAEKKAAEDGKGETGGVTLSAESVAAIEALGKIGAEGLLAIAQVANATLKEAADEKETIVKALVANELCHLTEELLKGYDLDALRGLDQAYNPIAASFAARGLPRTIEPASGDDYKYPGILLREKPATEKKN